MHAGIADARMWEPLVPWFQGHEPVSYDLRGHGQMDDADEPFHHVDDLLELLGERPAVLVGASLGARVALEAAVLRPGLVRGLVLLGATVPGRSRSASSEAHGAEQARLLAAGDLDGAAASNVHYWVVGAGRTAGEVPREVLRLASAMQRRTFAVQAALGVGEAPRVAELLPRLPELACPVLVVVGEHDRAEAHATGRAIAAAVPGAALELVPGTAHLPSLEAPARVGPLVERFLRRLG